MASVELLDILYLFYRMVFRVVIRGKSRGLKKLRNTYQNDYVNQSAWRIFQECDLAGHCHPSFVEDDMIDLEL